MNVQHQEFDKKIKNDKPQKPYQLAEDREQVVKFFYD